MGLQDPFATPKLRRTDEDIKLDQGSGEPPANRPIREQQSSEGDLSLTIESDWSPVLARVSGQVRPHQHNGTESLGPHGHKGMEPVVPLGHNGMESAPFTAAGKHRDNATASALVAIDHAFARVETNIGVEPSAQHSSQTAPVSATTECREHYRAEVVPAALSVLLAQQLFSAHQRRTCVSRQHRIVCRGDDGEKGCRVAMN
jgi:hypothetical protein